jgi:hypothetical protein
MRNWLSILLTISLLVVLTIGSASAAPVNYTFKIEGPASAAFDGNNLNVTPGTFLYDQGFNKLATAYYTIQIDIDAPGSLTRMNNTTTYYSDNSIVDYFFTDYVSGPIATAGGVSGASVKEYNYGNTNHNSGASQIRVGSQDSYLNFSSTTSISDWVEGTNNITLLMQTYDNYAATFDSNLVINNVELTAINPVPVPAAFWLLGSGLLGLAGMRKKVLK